MPKSNKKSSSAKRKAKKAKETAKKIAEQQQQAPAHPTPSPQQGSDPPTTMENPTIFQPSAQSTPEVPDASTINASSLKTQSSSGSKINTQKTSMTKQPTSVEKHKEIDPDLIPKSPKTPDLDRSNFLAHAAIKTSVKKSPLDSQSQSIVATVVENQGSNKKKEEREANWKDRKKLKEIEVSSDTTPKIQNCFIEQTSQILDDSDIMALPRGYFDQVDSLMNVMDLRMDEETRNCLQE